MTCVVCCLLMVDWRLLFVACWVLCLVCGSSIVGRCSLFVVRCLLFVVRCLLFVGRRLLSAVCWFWPGVYCSSLVVRCRLSLFVVGCVLCVACNVSVD